MHVGESGGCILLGAIASLFEYFLSVDNIGSIFFITSSSNFITILIHNILNWYSRLLKQRVPKKQLIDLIKIDIIAARVN